MMHISHLAFDIVHVLAFAPVVVGVFPSAIVSVLAVVVNGEAVEMLVGFLVIVDVCTEDEIGRVDPMERDRSERLLRSSCCADQAEQICELMELTSS